MIYYIDGYNLIFSQLSDVSGEKFSQSREEALKAFCQMVSSFNLSIIVIFDAYKRPGEFSRIKFRGVEVIYTREGQKADDFIIESLERSSKPHEKVVVTNDKGLARAVSHLNGHVLAQDDFTKLLKKKRGTRDEKEASNLFDHDDLEYYERRFIDRLKSEEN